MFVDIPGGSVVRIVLATLFILLLLRLAWTIILVVADPFTPAYIKDGIQQLPGVTRFGALAFPLDPATFLARAQSSAKQNWVSFDIAQVCRL
jgi:hypothetical protein